MKLLVWILLLTFTSKSAAFDIQSFDGNWWQSLFNLGSLEQPQKVSFRKADSHGGPKPQLPSLPPEAQNGRFPRQPMSVPIVGPFPSDLRTQPGFPPFENHQNQQQQHFPNGAVEPPSNSIQFVDDTPKPGIVVSPNANLYYSEKDLLPPVVIPPVNFNGFPQGPPPRRPFYEFDEDELLASPQFEAAVIQATQYGLVFVFGGLATLLPAQLPRIWNEIGRGTSLLYDQISRYSDIFREALRNWLIPRMG